MSQNKTIKYPFYPQRTIWECGLACVKMVCEFYRISYDFARLEGTGSSIYDLLKELEVCGFRAQAAYMTPSNLFQLNLLPCIAYMNYQHYTTVYEIGKEITLGDPTNGVINLSRSAFLDRWLVNDVGILILIQPNIP